jgi:TonB family protein
MSKKKPSKTGWYISGIIVLVFLVAGGGLFFLLKASEAQSKKGRVVSVALIRPAPPLKERPEPPKEKPPEPEVQKKEIETIREVVRQEENRNDKPEDKPAGNDLGVDAEGGAGSDSFGLVGKKGGRALVDPSRGEGGSSGPTVTQSEKPKIGGDTSPAALMRKFAWYNQLVQEEMKKLVFKRLDENGGIPKGKLEVVVQIVMDDAGNVLEHRIMRSSGNPKMDEAVNGSIGFAKMSEPPPQGIPRSMDIKILSQG